jgi:protein-S-isoprenylcysteine O-methyltransferase Ste14
MTTLSAGASTGLRSSGILRLVTIFLILAFQTLMIFLGAGSFNISRIWWFFLSEVLFYMVSISVMLLAFPDRIEIINQRGKTHKGTKKWDQVIVSVISLFSVVIIPVIAGFDIGHNPENNLSMNYFYLFMPLLFIMQIISQWAIIANPHFEPTVRIQEDRHHQVAHKGPYRFVRPPGYFSFILIALFTQLALGSLLAIIPVIAITALFILRTSMEDATLQNELKGYREYASIVKYRLFPGIW